MNHNNLYEFMNVKILNLKQIKWAVKLTTFNFIILHKSSKINSVNTLLKHFNYIKIISKSIDRFLSIL